MPLTDKCDNCGSMGTAELEVRLPHEPRTFVCGCGQRWKKSPFSLHPGWPGVARTVTHYGWLPPVGPEVRR